MESVSSRDYPNVLFGEAQVASVTSVLHETLRDVSLKADGYLESVRSCDHLRKKNLYEYDRVAI